MTAARTAAIVRCYSPQPLMSRARTLAPMAEPGGCQLADNCPAAGRGRWLKLVDKSGKPYTKHEPNGSFWNRRCPAQACPIRVHT